MRKARIHVRWGVRGDWGAEECSILCGIVRDEEDLKRANRSIRKSTEGKRDSARCRGDER